MVDKDVPIKVMDNGIGIRAGMQSEVFQMFAQAGDHLDHAQGGLGIGFALVNSFSLITQRRRKSN
ncbi:K+-sensing histidine kinase KdpD [Rhizobium sp. BK313]|jgi:K+-sensing histidine kinase KdpD|uniref:ATP-binding protein n=1 Tax=Rhizobium sp. BK313 TaxID=2587081 RepID=UPI0017A24991|nr:ATP-binding protein [Rhizobium sp. BK313]MBB3458168.1 K+-sensing histidine kinase KdpD [Rhizobium sp. BK313]